MFRILIVEDDADGRAALHRFLAAHGHRVESVGDVEAGERALGWGPEVVLLDLMLPRLSGLHLVESLRRMERVPRLAFISANVPPMIADYVPAPVYFRKPIDLHRLVEWIAEADPERRAKAADPSRDPAPTSGAG